MEKKQIEEREREEIQFNFEWKANKKQENRINLTRNAIVAIANASEMHSSSSILCSFQFGPDVFPLHRRLPIS